MEAKQKKADKKDVILLTNTKIPLSVKGKSIASGSFVVFGLGLMTAGWAFNFLQNKKTLPAYGKLKNGNKEAWFCLYGYFENEGIYNKSK
jgi:hypothetical protein